MRVLGFLYVGVASGVLLAGALRWLDLVGFFSMPVCIAVMAVSLVIEIVRRQGRCPKCGSWNLRRCKTTLPEG